MESAEGATSAAIPTLWALVASAATQHPDRVNFRDTHGRKLTTDGLRDAAEQVAAGLRLTERSVIVWQLPNCLEAIILMVAAVRVGAVQVPVIPILREHELDEILGQTNPDIIVVPERWRGFEHATAVRSFGSGGDMTAIDLETVPGPEIRLPVGDPATLSPAPSDADAVRWIYFSSGTTGRPKGVKHSDSTLIASSRSMTDRLAIADGDVYPVAWPITHIGGASVITAALQRGGCIVLFESFDPNTFGDDVAAYDPSILGTGVSFFRSYLDAQQRRLGHPLYPHLRVCTAGGAPTPPAMIQEIRATFGLPGILNAWGLTEFPIACCASADDPPAAMMTTVGRSSPGVQVRAVDGELRLKGPQCFHGYLDAGLDAAAFDDEGWFCTGDLGEIDSDGYVRITGRRKDIVIRNGENIACAEIEAILLRHPDVADAAVLGVPDSRTGERVVAVLTVRTGRSVTLADVADHFRLAGAARQKTPEQVHCVLEIPRNPMGKVVKDELRRLLDSSSGGEAWPGVI